MEEDGTLESGDACPRCGFPLEGEFEAMFANQNGHCFRICWKRDNGLIP